MFQLGHAFRCNGRELYRKNGTVFYFAYAIGRIAIKIAVVAAEVKGFVRRGATPVATAKPLKRV